MSNKPVNALTIDVEEYFQVSAFEAVIKRDDWGQWQSRVVYATEMLLDLLDEHSTKATFFTLGYIAQQHPQLIRQIVDRGHELGCHGLQHVRVVNQNAREFRQDIDLAKNILEDCAGCEVRGYRAASFSINRNNFWAFTEIQNAGFEYSSSVYPVKHDLYGIPDAPRSPFKPVPELDLLEIPVSTVRVWGRNIPAGGGGYFRFFPYFLTEKLIRAVNAEGLNANMYFHPWEFDPAQPRPQGINAKTRFRHYVNQGRSLNRLGRLLRAFSWGSMHDVYADFINQIASTDTGVAHLSYAN